MAIRLDAPMNKLDRLLNVPSINRAIHHPKQVSLDQIVADRGVLIVQGSMGQVGEGTTPRSCSRSCCEWSTASSSASRPNPAKSARGSACTSTRRTTS
jgi:hypothetical protein